MSKYMLVSEKAAFTRTALEVIANETDPKTAERIEQALNACGDLSLARLFDLLTTVDGRAELEERRKEDAE